jgi:uncharacterized lipoprotein YddW (UPF0748 family)
VSENAPFRRAAIHCGRSPRRSAAKAGLISALFFCWACLLQLPSLATDLVIDDFAYTNSTAARQAWSASSAPLVSMTSTGAWGSELVMLMPCDFATRNSRCYWDRSVSLNLADYTDFALKVYVSDPGPISSFTLYFKSVSGWYGASASLAGQGWQTLRFPKSGFVPEGTPAGWNQVTGIRLSPWKAASRNTTIAATQLRAFTPPVLLVRDDESSNPNIVDETINRHVDWLARYNIDAGVVSRSQVESGLLAQSQLAILPYNENISSAEWTALETFVAAGGKLLVYYLLPSRMEPLLGIRRTGWVQGNFGSWVFNDPSIANLPERVDQASWNITLAVPDGSLNSRTSAVWDDTSGATTGRAAWLTSDHGFFMSHVLLGDDADRKSYALLCLLGHFMPELWPSAAAGAIDTIGRVASYSTFADAEAGIRTAAGRTVRYPLAETELDAAIRGRQTALEAQAAANYSLAITSAHSSQAHLKQAYALSLRPVTPEFRAFWEHHATGPFPGNWPAAIDALLTNGFTAVFPNMLWGGLAHYNSAFLPRSSTFTNYGDQIAACVAAARAKGLQTHIWKVNWNLEGAPASFIASMRVANRTQVSRDGADIDWLCPSHPDNFALETNSMLEVVRNYDIDGIHFDYIRYPNSDHCYCTGCRDRFQAQTARSVTNWPADVLAAGELRTAFLDWRRAQITRLVAAVHDGAKAIKPNVKISAAVFPNATSAYDGVGQDWRLWITNGIVDFLCPMDYTTSFNSFTNLVAQQLEYAAGRIPIYPGIGAFILENDQFLAQLEATRTAKTGGFIVFELGASVTTNLLPSIRSGATAPDEPDRDGDYLPDSWELRWFPALTNATSELDSDFDGLNDREEYILGSDPQHPNPGLTLTSSHIGTRVQLAFPAEPASGPGYADAERHYRLETRVSLGSGEVWQPVSGLGDRVVSSPETVTVQTPVAETNSFYRVRVWLQQR